MKTRFAAALFALALPLLAQDKPASAASDADALFYKAYWLEKGERNFAEAMTLYEQFLAASPEHKHAKKAAELNYDLLTRTGKTKDADAFAKKYEKLLGAVTTGAPAAADGEGRGAGRGEGRGDARRTDQRPDLADLKKQLEEAKAAGDTERVAQLERQIQRMENAARDGAGAGQGQGRRGGRGMQAVEFAKMSPEELTTWKKDSLERTTGMIQRLRDNGMEDRAKQLEDSVTAIKAALDAGKIDEAQKLYDKMRESMGGGRRGGGGDAPRDGGGRTGGGATPAGGGTGRDGGGGGTGRDGGR